MECGVHINEAEFFCFDETVDITNGLLKIAIIDAEISLARNGTGAAEKDGGLGGKSFEGFDQRLIVRIKF